MPRDFGPRPLGGESFGRRLLAILHVLRGGEKTCGLVTSSDRTSRPREMRGKVAPLGGWDPGLENLVGYLFSTLAATPSTKQSQQGSLRRAAEEPGLQ